MIRFIEVGDEHCAWFLPVSAIEAFSKDENTGKASIAYVMSDTQAGEQELTHSILPYEKALPILLGLPPEPLILDLSKAEQDKIRRTLNATQQTLDEIQPRLQPGPTVGLDSDVYAVVTMLKNGEYGEHWAGTELGGRLETEITKLVGSENEKANRLRRAEELLAEVWHEWNNDDATRKALGDDMGNVIGSFIYPDRTNC